MFFRGPNLATEMGGNTSKRVQACFCTLPYESSLRVSWPFLATCGLTRIRVNMLQHPPISCQNVQQSLDRKSEKSERERSVHQRMHLALSGPSLRRKCHKNVMSIVMGSGGLSYAFPYADRP